MAASTAAATFVAPLGGLGKLLARGAEAAEKAPVAEKKAAFEPFRRAFVGAMRTLHRPRASIVFLSGAPNLANPLALAVTQSSYQHQPCLFVPAAAVLSEAGEMEGGFAAAGAGWSSGSAEVALGETLEEALGAVKPGGSLALFTTDEAPNLELAARGRRLVFGSVSAGPMVLANDGAVSLGAYAVVRFDDAFSPVVEASSAARVVSEVFTVTAAEGSMILGLNEMAALDVLTESTGGGKHRGLVVLKVEHALEPHRIDLRPIRGVDPTRKGIAIRGEAHSGMRIAFAVRDPATAKHELEESVRRTEERARGSQPTLGLYVSCAGRQRALYGEADTELRIIRRKFPKLPLAGMFGAFQIVPRDGGAEQQLMGSVLALFRAPS